MTNLLRLNDLHHTFPVPVADHLYQARRHHRHALRALREGCYDSLSSSTRARLVRRLQAGLAALNRTLGAEETDPPSEQKEESAQVPFDCPDT